MRYLYLIFTLFYTSLISQELKVTEIKNIQENVVLDINEAAKLIDAESNEIIIRGFYFLKAKRNNQPDIYSCIPSFDINSLINVKFQEYTGGLGSFSFKVKTQTADEPKNFKIEDNDKWANHDLYIFMHKDNSLYKKLKESQIALKIKDLGVENLNNEDIACFRLDKIDAGSFCYVLERLFNFIEKFSPKLTENEQDKIKAEEYSAENFEKILLGEDKTKFTPYHQDFFSIEIQNTLNLISKYSVPNSNDFLSNYSNINFFEVGADVYFTPKNANDSSPISLQCGIGYRNSTQVITNKIDNVYYSIENPEGFINSKNIYLNNVRESIKFNLHSLNVFAGCEYYFNPDNQKGLSIGAEIFGRYYIPSIVESRLTSGAISYRATSDAINEELMDIPDLGLIENVSARNYRFQTNRIKGFGFGANIDLCYRLKNIFISAGFSFTNNVFSVDNTNNSSVLTSELNDYSSSLSISEGFKNQIFGLNVGFGYKFK